MAFNDTLFQLGMDLTRSSTAQTEDHSRTPYASETVAHKAAPVGPTSPRIEDCTLFIDLHGAKKPADARSARSAMKRAIETLGLKATQLFVDLRDNGAFSGVAVVGDGHISVAECPRSGLFAVNAGGTSGFSACDAMMAFANAFGAREAVIQKARRPSVSSANAPIPLHAATPARRAAPARRVARAA